MNVSLRQLEDRGLDAIYQQSTDPESVRMAAFTSEDQTLVSTAISHPVAVRRSRKRSCASTEVGTELAQRYAAKTSAHSRSARSANDRAAVRADPENPTSPVAPSAGMSVHVNAFLRASTIDGSRPPW
jgi:hypothetical protein